MDTILPSIFPGVAEWLLIGILMAVPILVVIWFARKTLENKRENTKLRLEVGKLADELEQVRKRQPASKPMQ